MEAFISYCKYYWDCGNNSVGGEPAGYKSLYSLLGTGSQEYISDIKSKLIVYLRNWDSRDHNFDLEYSKCSLPEIHAFSQGPLLKALSQLEEQFSGNKK